MVYITHTIGMLVENWNKITLWCPQFLAVRQGGQKFPKLRTMHDFPKQPIYTFALSLAFSKSLGCPNRTPHFGSQGWPRGPKWYISKSWPQIPIQLLCTPLHRLGTIHFFPREKTDGFTRMCCLRQQTDQITNLSVCLFVFFFDGPAVCLNLALVGVAWL